MSSKPQHSFAALSLVLGGAYVAGLELLRIRGVFGSLRAAAVDGASFALLTFAVAIVSFATVALPLAMFGRLLKEKSVDVSVVWSVLAALFFVLWHATLMQGDGIRAVRWYWYLRIGSATVGALCVGLIVRHFVAPRALACRPPGAPGVRPWMHWISLALGPILLFAATALQWAAPRNYPEFHGLLGFVNAWAAWYVSRRVLERAPKAVATLGLALLVFSVTVLGTSRGEAALRHVRYYSPTVAQMPLSLSLSLGGVLLGAETRSTDSGLTAAERTQAEATLAAARGSVDASPRGQNVLFIVLESTRWDDWADPKIAARFHEWRKHGVYLPHAVAQYPATPLAYGSMFTSQYPSVLVRTPNWARRPLFDDLAPKFEYVIFSRPKNKWFDRGAITNFFSVERATQNQHQTATDGLQWVKRQLTSLPSGASFFTWLHLYEPHAPYVMRPKWMRGSDERAVYQSEVRYTDDALGEFMTWFYTQPMAQETLVVMIGDHGEGTGQMIDGRPFWGHHVQVRNDLAWVPAYFGGPGLPGNAISDVNVAQIDVMPTMFDFIGVPLRESAMAQGHSVYGLLQAPAPRALATEAFSIRGKEFFEFVESVGASNATAARERFQQVMQRGQYSPKLGLQYGMTKLIYDQTLERKQVFELERDPHERRDVSREAPALTERLMAKKAEWERLQTWVVQVLDQDLASPE